MGNGGLQFAVNGAAAVSGDIALSLAIGQTFSIVATPIPDTIVVGPITYLMPAGLPSSVSYVNGVLSGSFLAAGVFDFLIALSFTRLRDGTEAGSFFTGNVTVTVSGGSSPVIPDPSTVSTATPLKWFQARYLAVLNYKIRLIGWADRYLEFDGHLWWMQTFNSVSKVLGDRTEVKATDFTTSAFPQIDLKSTQWTTDGIIGQTVQPAHFAAALKVTKVYP